jgi:hypothetical protein
MSAIVHGDVYIYRAEGHNRLCFRNPRGLKRYYSFYVPDVGAADATIEVEYSTDGVNWANAPATVMTFDWDGSIGDIDCFDIKIRDDGSQLEVWVVAIGEDGTIGGLVTKYCYGTIADASSTISWNAVQVIDAALGDEIERLHCVAIARTDNGRLVVAFTEDDTNMGKDYRSINLIGSDGDGAAPNWSGETIWDDPSGDSNNQNKGEVFFGLENFDSSYPNRCLLYARIPEATDVTSYEIASAVPDWNGAAFSNTTQNTGLETGNANTGSFISGLIDESDIAHFVYEGSSKHVRHRKAASAGDDDWGASTLIRTVVGSLQALTITLDTGPATDWLYVFYRENDELVDFHYKTSPVGAISWSSEATVSIHGAVTRLSSWNRVIENSLCVLFAAGAPTTVLYYNEHPVYKALSTTLADLEFPDQNYYLGPHDL